VLLLVSSNVKIVLKEKRREKKPGNLNKRISLSPLATQENLRQRERESELASIFRPPPRAALKQPVYQDTAERKASDVGGAVKVERSIHPRRGEQTGREFPRLLVIVIVIVIVLVVVVVVVVVVANCTPIQPLSRSTQRAAYREL